MIIFLIVLLVLALILATPVGILADFQNQLTIRLKVSFLRFQVYPPKKQGTPKEKKSTKKRENKLEKQPAESKDEKAGPTLQQIFYSIENLLPVVFRSLERVGRRLRIDPLEIHVIFAGEDPADVALFYGRCQALVAALLPLVEQTVTIRHRDIHLETDFQGERTVVSGRIGARLLVWDGLILLGSLAAGGISWLRGYRSLGKGTKKTTDNHGNTAAAVS